MQNIIIFVVFKVQNMLDKLFEKSQRLIKNQKIEYKRFLFDKINWENKLIGIKGARGTGKSTLMLQYLKSLKYAHNKVLYLSLDDIYFASNSLIDLVDQFYKQGGKLLVLDEIHKYESWTQVLKNIYDFYPELKIIFSGSSILELSSQKADLSRRILMYDLPGLSYREYLGIKKIAFLNSLNLEEILNGSEKIDEITSNEFRPLEHFQNYLNYGYYPFGLDNEVDLYQRVNQLVRTIVEIDMSELSSFDKRNAAKILHLIGIIAQQVPFKPNLSDLAVKTTIHRNTLHSYLSYLEQAKIVQLLYPSGISTAMLKKPEKIFLNNSSILKALGGQNVNKGTIRETFVLSQLSVEHQVHYPKTGDFLVDQQYLLEVGGKTKGFNQLTDKDKYQSYVVADDLEYIVGKKIPIWLFGFLY